MSSREAILARAKNRRRRQRNLKLMAAAALTLTLIALLIWSVETSYLRISTVYVTGTIAISGEEIKSLTQTILAGDYFNLIPKNHFLWYPREEIKQAILTHYPRAEQVSVGWSSPTAITINLKERAPEVLVCGEHCFFADSTGLIYASAPIFSQPVYLIWNLGSTTANLNQLIVPTNQFVALNSAANYFTAVFKHRGLSAWQITTIKGLTINDFQLLAVNLKNNQQLPILVTAQAVATASAQNLDLTLDYLLGSSTVPVMPPLEYLDLRFGNKVFYK